MDDKKEDSLYHWVMLSIFSAVVLGSSVDTFSNPDARMKWAISCSTITMSIAAIVTFTYKLKPDLVGSKIEGGLRVVVLVCWVINLAFYRGEIFAKDAVFNSLYANIYYFSWAAFFTAVRLVASYLSAELDVSNQHKTRLNNWFMLLALNLVVMCTSSYDFSAKQQYKNDKWGRLTMLALLVGVITSSISFATMFLTSTTLLERWQSKIECLFSLINTVIYAVTIGFINGTDGPGARIGNIYYFMWLSFLMSTLLTFECCDDLWMTWTEPEIEHAETGKDTGTVGDDEHPELDQAEKEKETVGDDKHHQETQQAVENVAVNV